MGLHVIYQEGRRQEHNKENEHVFSISVLGLMLRALSIFIHKVIATVQKLRFCEIRKCVQSHRA